MKYFIMYDYCDATGYENKNIEEIFEGDWFALQKHIKRLRAEGCYNIDATAEQTE